MFLLFVSAVTIALACQAPDCDRVDCGSCGKLLWVREKGSGRGGEGVSDVMIVLAFHSQDCDRL